MVHHVRKLDIDAADSVLTFLVGAGKGLKLESGTSFCFQRSWFGVAEIAVRSWKSEIGVDILHRHSAAEREAANPIRAASRPRQCQLCD